jgi:hypothetical protein
MDDPIWRDQGNYIIAETAEGRFGSTVFGVLERMSGA